MKDSPDAYFNAPDSGKAFSAFPSHSQQYGNSVKTRVKWRAKTWFFPISPTTSPKIARFIKPERPCRRRQVGTPDKSPTSGMEIKALLQGIGLVQQPVQIVARYMIAIQP
ncbi:MAG TPA: hypothetical protein PLS67_00445 [Accumulibacter sp.]|nr:hypothetical protein [Accumulibacter sp.]HQC78970.1 hypothetical protein [Accumulibacter sp.]